MTKTCKTLQVTGLSSNTCEQVVRKSLGGLDGIDHISIDQKEHEVTVEYDSDKVTDSEIKQAIQQKGFEVN